MNWAPMEALTHYSVVIDQARQACWALHHVEVPNLQLTIGSNGISTLWILTRPNTCSSVMMNNLEYSEKLASLFGDGSYSKVKKDPTLRTERKILNKDKDYFALNKYRQLTQRYQIESQFWMFSIQCSFMLYWKRKKMLSEKMMVEKLHGFFPFQVGQGNSKSKEKNKKHCNWWTLWRWFGWNNLWS